MTGLPPEDVQSYPRPPALEPVPQRIRVQLGSAIIVDTTAAWRVLETHHAPSYYIPVGDVTATLRSVTGSSWCEWKGAARYYDVIAGGRTATRAAWAYDTPSARFAPIAGHVAFYAGLVDAAWVGEVQVQPQPGDFYGGWVTPNLTGRIKGAAGTRHW
ncbi:Uncharacterized conserved protein, DUF427 family [Loktanella fryxellensis]|uniref:Uncharacterized conserved protein, DUF427 family n=1 Tax=Loktanella fryxellensis TaxID=245187 RepID=A0A1H8C6A6_9RHOB|nr:DUF427 domain-containing protein [Loktanella fryxellensis]SEM90721.1 Uncharacterized conserved protein, DUF427 family [Loktanella fryxellensis]